MTTYRTPDEINKRARHAATSVTPEDVVAMSHTDAVIHGLLRCIGKGYVQEGAKPVLSLAVEKIEELQHGLAEKDRIIATLWEGVNEMLLDTKVYIDLGVLKAKAIERVEMLKATAK